MATKKNQYYPESVSYPGTTLAEKLDELGMGSKEFAIRTGKPEKTISEILSGESSITPDMAVLFEGVLKIPASFWLTRQRNYDEAVARLKRVETIANSTEWAENFPYAQMASYGWVSPTRKVEEKVKNLFDYFSVGNQKAFEDYYFNAKLRVNFRVSLAHTRRPYAFAAWLRQGEVQASSLGKVAYKEKSLLNSLPELKRLMAEHPSDFFKRLQSICLRSGLRVVYTPCINGASINGSTRWIGDSPLIQLSARYKQNDIFWFTFFHEIAHILMHGKKYVALEDVDYEELAESKEKEADEFAVKWTFSKEEEEEVLKKPVITEEDVEFFAKKFNTHPACIIGRFHHKKLIEHYIGRRFIEKIDLSQ